MLNTRTESDSIGFLEIPKDAYYGVQSYRGAHNFLITGNRINYGFILNIVKIKKASAIANFNAGKISAEVKDAIITASNEILDGRYKDEFITDAIQGGAGTTVNMNVNEVIANRATEILGGKKGEYLCHPNDHVNRSQSTNDVIPTAGKLTVLELGGKLLSSLDTLINSLNNKAKEFDGVIKMGRTQLQDAVPIRLGQEFSAYASGLNRCKNNIVLSLEQMKSINLGGTAIGTSINTSKEYLSDVIQEISNISGYSLTRSEDLIDATQNLDSFVNVSGALKTLAVNLSKISNDLRLMSSGPKTGLSEINLPAKQNGSSIMPGKVNPVIPEVVSQVAFAVIGNDTTITMAAEAGQLELNAFEPVIFYKLFESLETLKNAMDTLTVNCIVGITANADRCADMVYGSVAIITALCPYVGYKKSAEIAKEALLKNIPVKTLIKSYKLLDDQTLDKVLDPLTMTTPKI